MEKIRVTNQSGNEGREKTYGVKTKIYMRILFCWSRHNTMCVRVYDR